MRFVVDECTGPRVARWLVGQGHDVLSIYNDARGISDDEVLALAYGEQRILITNDKDFGEKVFREHRKHHGIVLLRLADERPVTKIDVLERLLSEYGDKLADQYVVVTETQVRFAHTGTV